MGNSAYKAANVSKGLCRNGCGNKISSRSSSDCDECLAKKRIYEYGESGVERLAAQGGRCPGCLRRISITDRRTHIDHCRRERGGCGGVRSVSCGNCNTIEGHARATGELPWITLRRLADYMEWHDTQDCPGHDTLALCDPPEAYE
jgi:hypothetical protein